MRGVRGWLEARHPVPPASLRAAMARALETGVADEAGRRSGGDNGTSVPVAGRLAEAALATLAGVIRGDGGRASAAQLLAADALLTYACEAAAADGPAALDGLTAGLDAGRFERVLAGEGS